MDGLFSPNFKPDLIEAILRASIILATSMLLGQRVVQDSQETHNQIEALFNTSSFSPIRIICIIWFGWISIAKETGHPLEHVLH
jgi:hypothetical protein